MFRLRASLETVFDILFWANDKVLMWRGFTIPLFHPVSHYSTSVLRSTAGSNATIIVFKVVHRGSGGITNIYPFMYKTREFIF